MSELNLYQKLIKIRESVKYLKKDNKGDRFAFVSSSQVLGAIRLKMDEYRVFLKHEIIDAQVETRIRNNGNIWNLTCVKLKFTWINADNPDQKEESEFYAQGLDDGERGVGKACTYGEKYFLLKSFNIPTDAIDPDRFQKEYNFQNKPAQSLQVIQNNSVSSLQVDKKESVQSKQDIQNNSVSSLQVDKKEFVQSKNLQSSAALSWTNFYNLKSGFVPDQYYELFGLNPSLGLKLKKIDDTVICIGKTFNNLDIIKSTKMFKFQKQFSEFKNVWVCQLQN